MATKKIDKVYTEYFAFDILDEGDGPYIVDHEITSVLNEAEHYTYMVAIQLPSKTKANSKLLATVKV